MSNGAGEVVWQAHYTAYGNAAIKVDTLENPIRFQGQYYDEESGLHYNRHRYYDPSLGQFTTQDPIGLLGGVNNYQYAPNPVEWVDPFGLTAKPGDCPAAEEQELSAKLKEIEQIEKGMRPAPGTYLPKALIDAHKQKFNEHGAAFIAVGSWTTGSRYPGLPPRKFVGLKPEMDKVITEYEESGDWKVLVQKLDLGEDVDLTDEQVLYVTIDPGDPRFLYEIPDGNEAGAIPGEWVPGGKTKSGTPEAALVGSEKVKHNQSLSGYQKEFKNTKMIKDK